MLISLVAAVSTNQVIGKNNQLIWHLPADLKHFKNITTGHTILMGRKTFDSIGKPLPNRRNIIISRSKNLVDGCEVADSLEVALKLCEAETEIFIIGGAEIYKQSMQFANRIYLTKIHQKFEGDTFFPEIDLKIWQETFREDFSADEKNKFAYSFVTLNKR